MTLLKKSECLDSQNDRFTQRPGEHKNPWGSHVYYNRDATTGELKAVLKIIKTEVRGTAVMALCEDGNWYHVRNLSEKELLDAKANKEDA